MTHAEPSPPETVGRLPDFVIIGAMKCGTSTLHQQLAADPRFCMSTPKEPCFFSDDDAWERGLDWYRGLFSAASQTQLCGESSTHYTKLPTHQRTIERMQAAKLDARFIYVVRDPADRLISQFIHEWTMGLCGRSIDRAIAAMPHMVDYGAYGAQLRPYVETFGAERVLAVPFASMRLAPDLLMQVIGEFLGVPDLRWQEIPADNVSRERIRVSAFTRWWPESRLRRAIKPLLPRSLYERGKRAFQMRSRPTLTAEHRTLVERALARDLTVLEDRLGVPVAGRTWDAITHDWIETRSTARAVAADSAPPVAPTAPTGAPADALH